MSSFVRPLRVARCVATLRESQDNGVRMARLTELKAQTLVKEGRAAVVAVGDGSGLALRITRSGATWHLRSRCGGKPHWLTLAKYSDCTLKEAQKKATKERARINEGID